MKRYNNEEESTIIYKEDIRRFFRDLGITSLAWVFILLILKLLTILI